MVGLLLALGVLLTRVASSVPIEHAACDDCVEAEYFGHDYDCPFSSGHHQVPEITFYSGNTPVGAGNPYALNPPLPPFNFVPPNYGRLPPFYGFNHNPAIPYLPNGPKTWLPPNYVNFDVGCGLPVVNVGNTEIIGKGASIYDGKTVVDEDKTYSCYPNEESFLYTPDSGFEDYPDKKFIKLPFTNPTSSPYSITQDQGYLPSPSYNLDQTTLPSTITHETCYPNDDDGYQEFLPPLYQGSSTQYDNGYPQQTFSNYPLNVNQYGYEYGVFPPTYDASKSYSATVFQHGYPRSHVPCLHPGYGYPHLNPKEEISEHSSTVVQNGYATDGYPQQIIDYHDGMISIIPSTQQGLGYDTYNAEQFTSKSPSTLFHQKDYPKKDIDGFSSQEFGAYDKCFPNLSSPYVFEYEGLQEQEFPKVHSPAINYLKQFSHEPYLPTPCAYGYDIINSYQDVPTKAVVSCNDQAIIDGDITLGKNLYDNQYNSDQYKHSSNPQSSPYINNISGSFTNYDHKGAGASCSVHEPSQELIKLCDGCSVTQSQLEDVIQSFQVPEECILTVPHVFTGPLDQFAHVMNCFPASMDVNDGFVHLPSDLLVPYRCYKHIASVFASDLPLFQNTMGVVLSNGQLIDSHIVASIVASAKSPERRLIITHNDLVIPHDIFKTYISKLSQEDKKHLKVLLPGVKEPVCYDTFKEIFEMYVGKFHNKGDLDNKKSIKLLGSKTVLSLEQFLSVLENCDTIKKSIITLPSQKTMPLTSFVPLADILGDEYTKTCLINIPNTPHSLPFSVVREIFELYLGNDKFDMSKDTDVNWNVWGGSKLHDGSDVEILPSFNKCFPLEKEYLGLSSSLNGEIVAQEPHYLLCRKQSVPTCNVCCADGASATEGELFDKRTLFSPYSRLVNDVVKVHKPTLNLLPPVATEPVYACERFEKLKPQSFT